MSQNKYLGEAGTQAIIDKIKIAKFKTLILNLDKMPHEYVQGYILPESWDNLAAAGLLEINDVNQSSEKYDNVQFHIIQTGKSKVSIPVTVQYVQRDTDHALEGIWMTCTYVLEGEVILCTWQVKQYRDDVTAAIYEVKVHHFKDLKEITAEEVTAKFA